MRAVVLAVIGLLVAARAAAAQTAQMQLDGREAYAGMPFAVAVVAEGFEVDPAPVQPTLSIPGAKVTALGVSPRVSTISINGRRHEEVTWVFRWKVEADKAGSYQVAPVTISQGARKATAPGGAVQVAEIAATDDMKLIVTLPSRPVWLGEMAPVEIDWLLRRDVHDQQLSVPLLSMPGELTVIAPTASDPRQTLAFATGATELQLPFARDSVIVGGAEFTRFRFTVHVIAQHAGTIEVPASQVVASLEVGTGRDRFGFPSARTQLFRATDVARTLEVKPLPQSGRPASFAGAVGTSFSIAARTSRSVVQLGEPVDLEITVRGDARLDGLALGPIGGAQRLPADRFAMPDTTPPGELSDDGKTKLFRVAIQVTDPATTEIPPIELSWFDPAVGQYRTTQSEPIALSVKGGSIVGAADVVGGKPSGQGDPVPAASVSLVGADLALSAPGAALDRPLGGGLLWALVIALYLIPLAVLAMRIWRLRTAGRREEAGEVATARRRVDDELTRARTAPAREVAADLVAALRQLRRVLGRSDGDATLRRLETETFAPGAADRPLADELQREAAALAATWRSPRPRGKSAAAAVVLLILATASPARADAPAQIAAGRDAYQHAMSLADPTARQAAFATAAAALAAAVAEHPDNPELLADWGNAALGAADFGTATLAYRRALMIDGDHTRARRNLNWLRARLPANLRPHDGGATATLFFFHGSWPRSTRLLVGAFAFALAVLLLIPWRRRVTTTRLSLAVIPALIWVAMTASLMLERDPTTDAVVIQSHLLRSADHAGSPAALTVPLPPGAEVTILERRGGWTRIQTPAGATGWLPDPALAPVTGTGTGS